MSLRQCTLEDALLEDDFLPERLIGHRRPELGLDLHDWRTPSILGLADLTCKLLHNAVVAETAFKEAVWVYEGVRDNTVAELVNGAVVGISNAI